MRLRFKIIMTIIDLLILAGALIFIFAAAYPTEAMAFLQTDATGVLIWVFLSYAIVVGIIEFFMQYMRQDTWFAKIAKGFITALIIVLLFPVVLGIGLYFLGYTIDTNLEQFLIGVAIVRTVIKIIIGRRWEAA